MNKITVILVPYDFSEAAKAGFRYAVNFAGHRPGIHLRVCFIMDEGSADALSSAFEELTKGLSKAFRAKISWTSLIPGSVRGLIEKSKAETTDMIIMGTSGSGDPQVTTKTSEMVLSAECPVLVVPMGAQEEFTLSKIALVLGPNEIDDPALLTTLLDVSRSCGARVTVLTIENEPGTYGYSPEEERNEHLLEYYLESFYSHHAYIRNDDVVQGIFDYVDKHEIDMVAILPRKHAREGTPSEGRLTRILTLQSKTPLLAIEH
ncbi:MAG: universal stress protein [Robiginitalea sp.]|jgi:nucleotide-binding universal stress UspA family protein